MLSLAEFRSRFPIFGRRVYVNSCSQGALSLDVDAAMRAYLESWHDAGSPWDLWVGEVERLRGRFAAAIGADADEIAVMPSASAGINAVASALDFSGRRSHVAMGEFEFPTMAQIWLAQQRRGASIRWAPAAGDSLPLSAYEAVVDERTLVVPATHVCYRNGHRTDIAGLARLAHDRGAYVFLDDYQRTGSGPIDVHALGVDFMVTGCLKYLRGGIRDRVPLRAPRSHRATRADDHRLVRPRESVRVRHPSPGLGADGEPVRVGDASGTERLRRAGGARPAERGRVRRDRPPGRAPRHHGSRRPRAPPATP